MIVIPFSTALPPPPQRIRSVVDMLRELADRPLSPAAQAAAAALNDYTRVRMREDGIARRILPPVPIGNDELDRPADTDRPVQVSDSLLRF